MLTSWKSGSKLCCCLLNVYSVCVGTVNISGNTILEIYPFSGICWRPVPVVKSMSFWNDKSGQGSDMKMASSSLDLLSPKVKVSKKTEDSLVIYWHWYPYPWRDLSWWLKWDLNQGQVSSKEHFKQRCDHYVSSDWSTNQMMAFDVQVN